MLTRFEVQGFKNFDKRIVLDFTDVRDYQFNTRCIKDQLLNKIIVYGKNAVGKSNLGLALFDIITHLTEKNVGPGLYGHYLNADGETEFAEFYYEFRFGQTNIAYSYRKSGSDKLLYEKVVVDDDWGFTHDFVTGESIFKGVEERVPQLNLEFKEANLSLLRYIVNNSKTDDVKPLSMLMSFVSRMLWFRSLDENRYIGYKTESSDYIKFIFEGDTLEEFEAILHRAGIDEKLIAVEDQSGDRILCFDKKRPIPFWKVASNGTRALYTVFYWLKTSQDLSLLFIDEFDAYYHTELSETIVDMLEGYQDFQTILTSHNTNLLTNRIMRPDCYFILTSGRLVSFSNATKRELREGHNLGNLYLRGEFD